MLALTCTEVTDVYC